MAQVDKFLDFLVKNGGSDLHLVTGSPPIVRIDGRLQKMKLPPLTAEQVMTLIAEIARVRGELRHTHVRAHVEMRGILNDNQVKHYDRLRGYTE